MFKLFGLIGFSLIGVTIGLVITIGLVLIFLNTHFRAYTNICHAETGISPKNVETASGISRIPFHQI